MNDGAFHLRITLWESLVIQAFNSLGLKPPQRSVSVGSAQCTSNLVAQGSVSRGSRQHIPALQSAQCQTEDTSCEISGDGPPISVITLKGRTLSPAAQLFLDFTHRVITPLASQKQR